MHFKPFKNSIIKNDTLGDIKKYTIAVREIIIKEIKKMQIQPVSNIDKKGTQDKCKLALFMLEQK